MFGLGVPELTILAVIVAALLTVLVARSDDP